MKSRIDDKLSMAAVRPTGNAAMQVVDSLQRFPSETRALGLAVSFLLLCSRYHVDPRRVLGMASNLMNHDDGTTMRPEFRAVRNYLEEEMDDD